MNELRFDDRVVVVTGAGRGIGLAKDGLSVEDIAENLDTIMDVTGAAVTESR